MDKKAYYIARAAVRAAVREKTRVMQVRERSQQKNPQLFKKSG